MPSLSPPLPSPLSFFFHLKLIISSATGDQPFVTQDGSIVLVTNGEIYNHKEIRSQFSNYEFMTKSDSEAIIPLYLKYGVDAPKHLDGMFSFVLLDVKKNRMIVARDPIGITSLYQGMNLHSDRSRRGARKKRDE